MADDKNFRKIKPPPQKSPQDRYIEFDFEKSPGSGLYRPLEVDAEHGLDTDTGTLRKEGTRSVEPPRKTADTAAEAPGKTSNLSDPMPTQIPTIQPTISDFRRNTDRQRREQRAATNLLSGVAYIFLGGLVLLAVLAGFGGYVLWKQIKNQSVTVAQLNAKVDQQDTELSQRIEQIREEIKAQAEAQAATDQQQQDRIGKLASLQEKVAAALREEKDARAKDVVLLAKRLQKLENASRARISP
jgi:uncharacterized protein HemX